jgi:hypothetical protein
MGAASVLMLGIARAGVEHVLTGSVVFAAIMSSAYASGLISNT